MPDEDEPDHDHGNGDSDEEGDADDDDDDDDDDGEAAGDDGDDGNGDHGDDLASCRAFSHDAVSRYLLVTPFTSTFLQCGHVLDCPVDFFRPPAASPSSLSSSVSPCSTSSSLSCSSGSLRFLLLAPLPVIFNGP